MGPRTTEEPYLFAPVSSNKNLKTDLRLLLRWDESLKDGPLRCRDIAADPAHCELSAGIKKARKELVLRRIGGDDELRAQERSRLDDVSAVHFVPTRRRVHDLKYRKVAISPERDVTQVPVQR